MEELQNRFKLNGEEYRLPVGSAIEEGDENPVSGNALYAWLRGLSQYVDREIADVVPGEEELTDSLSRALATIGSLVTYCAQLHPRSRHLTTLLPLDVLHVYDTAPDLQQDNKSRWSSDPIKKQEHTGHASYVVESSSGTPRGYRVHAYEWNGDNSTNRTTKLPLQPGVVYYVKYHTLSGSTVTEDRTKWGFYETDANGVLQLSAKLPL